MLYYAFGRQLDDVWRLSLAIIHKKLEVFEDVRMWIGVCAEVK